VDERKQAEVDYPERVGAAGREWLRTKPFANEPRETARHLIDAGYVIELLDLRPGMRFVELGCGSGWMTRFIARHGLDAHGYDISPQMIEIARAQAQEEGVEATFEAADFESLDLDRSFDRALTYDALHHSARPDLVIATAHRALKPGGLLLISEPNWKQRYQGRDATDQYGTTELGYSPRRLKRILKDAGFDDVRRFHNNRKRLFGNRPGDVLAHLAEPLTYRLLAPFWTQIWLRARAR
jgi:2-polyprenyl-3-methyl-5-hydroxy-6-metoxy-1,4-benzoquinol methylase